MGDFGVRRRYERTVHADDASEGRERGAFQRSPISLSESLASPCAARVRVLNDGADGLVEFLCEIPRGLQIDDVVVGKLFALKLAGIRHSRSRTVGVHRRFLVRVLAVAEIESLLKRKAQRVGENSSLLQLKISRSADADAFESGSNRGVIGGGPP